MKVLPLGSLSRTSSYALAAGFAVLAALLQWAIRPWVGSHVPFLFFLPALIFCAVTLGRAPATLVMIAGALNASLLSPPVGSFGIASSVDVAAVLMYAVVGCLLVLYGGHMRITTAQAAVAEKRLAIAQENTGMGVFELDFEAGTAYISAGLSQILGQPFPEGPIGLDAWLEQLSPGHVEDSKRAMRERAARGELSYEREQRVEIANGDVRWLLHRVRLQVDSRGRLTQARGATVDITARKQVDAELQATQAQLQQQLRDQRRLHAFSQKLVSTGEDMRGALQGLLELLVDLYDTDHGVVSLCDPVDRSFSIVAHCGFGAEALDKLPATLGTRRSASQPLAEVRTLIENVDYETLLIMHRALTLQEGLHGLHSMPLVNGYGQVLGAISVMFAERREPSEREMRLGEVGATTAAAVVERERVRISATNNEQRFSVALESSIVPFSILAPVREPDGRVVDFEFAYVNPAAARELGQDVPYLTGSRIGELMPKAWQTPGLFQRYVGVVERGEQCEFEVNSAATNRGGWFNVVASPLQGAVAVWFANITDRKIREQQLQEADRRKDEFLATLAHELRNPLAPIRQSVHIARSDHATDSQRQWSHDIIERQVQSMSLLLDDLLDVSRIGRGALLLRKSRELLSAIVDSAVETARPHLEAKAHRLEVTLPEHPVVLFVDPLRIAQVLGNLLTNAAKYTDPGGLIRLSARLEAQELVIRVLDNGIGLTATQARQVFELFAQIPSAMEKSQGGLGIGLALVRGLIELHSGSVEASSAGPGTGTVMTVRLPESCLLEAESVTGSNATYPTATGQRRARRILIADDNHDSADSLAALLRLEGHEVHVAYDGEKALQLFLSVDPDAALLDIAMPRLSGLEVVRFIRGLATRNHATLIAVTGWGQDADRRAALDSGFDHHLTKPIQPEQIQALLRLH
jgi:signal transduction histidine kinase